MAARVECAVEGRDLLGECPLWDERTRTLWWVDILGPALKQLDPASGAVRQNPLPEAMGSFAFRENGGLLAAMKSGLFLMDPSYTSVQPLAAPEPDRPANRFNDGRCDRAGRFWSGTMQESLREPSGALYRVLPDGTCERKRSGITVPNSLCWSPDGRTMYFADSPTRTILAFDYDAASGEPSNERVFATTQAGFPDGSCIDADGCLWNAEYGAWQVVRYTPAGKVDRTIKLAVQNPTCCCFGGQDFRTLYITTAAQRLSEEGLKKQPLAGSVFAVRPGSTGLPESRFTG
jgi:sugar lactone lactonase YvrE